MFLRLMHILTNLINRVGELWTSNGNILLDTNNRCVQSGIMKGSEAILSGSQQHYHWCRLSFSFMHVSFDRS